MSTNTLTLLTCLALLLGITSAQQACFTRSYIRNDVRQPAPLTTMDLDQLTGSNIIELKNQAACACARACQEMERPHCWYWASGPKYLNSDRFECQLYQVQPTAYPSLAVTYVFGERNCDTSHCNADSTEQTESEDIFTKG